MKLFVVGLIKKTCLRVSLNMNHFVVGLIKKTCLPVSQNMKHFVGGLIKKTCLRVSLNMNHFVVGLIKKPCLPVSQNMKHFVGGLIKKTCSRVSRNTKHSVMSYTDEKNVPGVALFTNFRKAFDTIEWDFLIDILNKFNSGPDVINWVKLFYNNVTSCVLDNGHASKFFALLGEGCQTRLPSVRIAFCDRYRSSCQCY